MRFRGALVAGLFALTGFVSAQPIPQWQAPPYWSPASASGASASVRPQEDGGALSARDERVAAVVVPPVPFVAISPCRQYDSRSSSALLQGTTRNVTLTGAPCNIPATAQAVSVNIALFNIAGATGNGVFAVGIPSGTSQAWVNYPPTQGQIDNAGVVSVNVSGQVAVSVNQGAGSVDFVVDVNGYYAPNTVALTRSIPALTCTPQGGALSGDALNCGSGSTLRTDGTSNFPCVVRSRTTLDTYLCDLTLPNGAIIQEIIAYGYDAAADGYMEAAVWATPDASIGPNYLSSGYGGVWQSTGIAATPSTTSFPIFQTSDVPHVVNGGNRYTIGFALKSGSPGTVYAYGFRVMYVLP